MANPAILKNPALNQKTYNKEFLDEAFNETIGLPEYDADTRKILFTRKDGAKYTVTIPLFEMPFTIEVDDVKKEIVFKFEDNTQKRVPMSELLINYEGTLGDQIQITVDPAAAEISAELLDGSITEEKLSSALAAKLGDIWVVEEI
jgi:hypothetical protein